jgi:hypothetical protein
MTRRVFVLIFAVMMNSAYGEPVPITDKQYIDKYILLANGIYSALGRFLLIRQQDGLCAIKFTGAKRGNDASEPTAFRGGEETFLSEYEWFFSPNYHGKWVASELKSGRSVVNSGSSWGIGRLAFGGGNSHIECGPMRFYWIAPTQLLFGDMQHTIGTQNYEMAPTKWISIDEVRPEAPFLKWFRYDEKRDRIDLRIDELW